MADNYVIKDGNGTIQTMAAKQVGTIYFPWHCLSLLVSGANVAVNGDSSGNIGVNVVSSALATGAATSANQTSQLTQETAIAAASGTPGDAVWGGSGNGTMIQLLKYIAAQDLAIKNAVSGGITATLSGSSVIGLTSGTQVILAAGANNVGNFSLLVSGAALSNSNPVPVSLPGGVTLTGTVNLGAGEAMVGHFGGMQVNPASTLTRPANTTGYAINNLIASSTTAGSVVVPAVSCARIVNGSFTIERARLFCTQTANLGGVTIKVRLWRAAPTYSGGDGAAYAVATGSANYLGSMTGVFEQFADGACAQMQVDFGPEINVLIASGAQSIYWDMMVMTAYTPTSGAVFNFSPEVKQD